jgi:hypothetical protein
MDRVRTFLEATTSFPFVPAAWSMIGASLIIGFITRILALSRYIRFQADQVTEANHYVLMWNGTLPIVGPDTTFHFALPPLYYYLVLPFTLLGHDPWLQALPNALFTFLSIPLLIFALYHFLGDLPASLRLFWAGLGGLWWSLMFSDIVLGTIQWNPSSVPFFALLFVLIATAQIRRPIYNWVATISWSFLGALLALLVSLHGSTLYVMPIVFLILSGAFIVRASSHVKATALVVLALGTAFCCLAPYWLGEIHNHWQNTQQMINQLHVAAMNGSPQEKLENVRRTYAWLSGTVYFSGSNAFIRSCGTLFLFMIAVVAILKFRGDPVLCAVLACLWLVFLYSAANYPPMYIHHGLLLVTAPIFLAVAALAFLTYDNLWNRVLGGFLALGIVASIVVNIFSDIKREAETFGPSRILSVSDIESAFSSLPYGSLVCSIRDGDMYIDQNVSWRNLHFSTTCMPGSYEVIPRFIEEDYDNNNYFHYNFKDDYYNFKENADVFITPFNIIPGPTVPADARIIKQNDAFTLIRVDKEFAPLVK